MFGSTPHQVGVVKTATFGTFWVTRIGAVDMDMPQCLVVQLVGVMVLQGGRFGSSYKWNDMGTPTNLVKL